MFTYSRTRIFELDIYVLTLTKTVALELTWNTRISMLSNGVVSNHGKEQFTRSRIYQPRYIRYEAILSRIFPRESQSFMTVSGVSMRRG